MEKFADEVVEKKTRNVQKTRNTQRAIKTETYEGDYDHLIQKCKLGYTTKSTQ